MSFLSHTHKLVSSEILGSTMVSLLNPLQRKRPSKKLSTNPSSKPTKRISKKHKLKLIVHGQNPKFLLPSLNCFTILNWTL